MPDVDDISVLDMMTPAIDPSEATVDQSKMKFFYGTFMQKQAFKNHYVQIQAVKQEHARAAMHEHFGDKFMTDYTEEQFKGQANEFGLKCLCCITVIDYGSSLGFIWTKPHFKHGVTLNDV